MRKSLKVITKINNPDAAEGAAFMRSLVESCRMNGKNPYDYLVDLLSKLGKSLDDLARRALFPDRWQPQC